MLDPVLIFGLFGFPAMGSIMVAVMNLILGTFMGLAVTFFGVYYKLQSFLFMPVNGLGQGTLPIIGFNYGAKNAKRVREETAFLYALYEWKKRGKAICGTM